MRLDPDDLAAAALQRADGEPTVVPDDAEDRATVDEFRRIVGLGRSLRADDVATDDPPADLWDRIQAELATGSGTLTRPGDTDAPPRLSVVPGGGGHVPEPPHHHVDAESDVVQLSGRRRAWRAVAGIAAAVVLLAGAAGLVISQQGGSRGGQELVAGADLELLAGGGRGEAQLVKRSDGMHLVVDVSGLTPAEQADFYELWLLSTDPANPDPQSLDKFDRRDGVIDVVVPPSIDPKRFPVVDISEELDDGDESHSGKSILRGKLV